MTAFLPKMKLWYYPMYRSARCVWLVKELGIEESVEYKYVPIGPPPPAPEREEYRKSVHPHSTVPALEIEGRPPILESAAICLYLADLCGRLAPEPKNRAEYYNWTLYSVCRLDEAMESLIAQWMFLPKDKQDEQVISKAKACFDVCLDTIEHALKDRQYILGADWTLYSACRLDEAMESLSAQWMFLPKDKQDEQVISKTKACVDVCLDTIEHALKDRQYILGAELTAADCVLGINIAWAAMPIMNEGQLLEDRPNIQAYWKRIQSRPAFQQAFTPDKL